MYVTYEKVSDKSGRVSEIIFMPTTADLAREGVSIDAPITKPENVPGMVSRLMVNLETDDLYYDYYTPETIETKVSGLQKENVELNQTIGNLILESANDKATIASLEDTVGSLLLEVAALKGGAE